MALAAYQLQFDALIALGFNEFGQTVGRTLKDTRALDGTELTWPKNGDANAAQLAWLLDHLRNTLVNLDDIIIPAVLPAMPAQMNWWRVQGKTLLNRWRVALTVDKDLYHDHVHQQMALGMRDRDELIAGAGRVTYQNWQAAVDANDLLGARAIHEGMGPFNRMIGRALHRFGPGAPVPRGEDLQAVSFQKYLGRCQKLEEAELESAYAAAFPHEQKREGLGAILRAKLSSFETMGASFNEVIAVIASTPEAGITVANLVSVPSLLFDKALKLTVYMMSIMFGARMGISPETAISAIVEKWTTYDQEFSQLTTKYGHGRATNSAHGYFTEVIERRMVEWIGHYWLFLKGSLAGADEIRFSEFFSEDVLIHHARYITLNGYVQQLRDQGPVAPPAPVPAAAAGGGGGGGGAAAPAPAQNSGGNGQKEQCPVCTAAGKTFPSTNHALPYCSLAKRQMGLNARGQARGWPAQNKGGGKGGGKGPGKGGKGKKGKCGGKQGGKGKGIVCWNCGGNHHRDSPDCEFNWQWYGTGFVTPWAAQGFPAPQMAMPPQMLANGPPGKGKGPPGPPPHLQIANAPHW
jgi:hypothetical protein